MALALSKEEDIKLGLSIVFGGDVIPEAYPNKCYCRKCKRVMKSYDELDRHHVTYNPVHLEWLCRRCHIRTTYLNRMKAIELRRKLNNRDRWEVWREFLSEVTTSEQFEESKIEMQDWFN